MPTLPDITIEEIGQLIQSLDNRDLGELVICHLDAETKARLITQLIG